MQKEMFFKVVCETVDVFEKTILIDKNCKNLDEVRDVIVGRPDLQSENVTWILYPLSCTLK